MTDWTLKDHQTWLGYLQPEGLVVSAPVLTDQGLQPERRFKDGQADLLSYLEPVEPDSDQYAIRDLREFLSGFLEWPDGQLAGWDAAYPIPDELRVMPPDLGEWLVPELALRRNDPPADCQSPWLLLVYEVPRGQDLDKSTDPGPFGFKTSPMQRLERLLRETRVPIGLLSNGTQLRLVYAPRGENSGNLTFPVQAMSEVAGRPIAAALHMLLCGYRVLNPHKDSLPELLKRSREYQSNVSTNLARQVLDALYELLRGFEQADAQAHGAVLGEVLERNADEVYSGLLTVLMRLVFLLYAEDRGLMPGSGVYGSHYSVHGLFERLRADHGLYPDTMDARYGAWSQLLALFRVVYHGQRHPDLAMPARFGHLFDPERYPFLEGRTPNERLSQYELNSLEPPRVPDGTLFKVLQSLLLLSGERLSYRTLDVEQIGSVYETMMGFKLRRATGPTLALMPGKAHGAPVPVNLDELLAEKPANRQRWLKERTDYQLTAKMLPPVAAATTLEALQGALDKRIARGATPSLLAAGRLILEPTDERRRTGSHYTPRSLTQPIVAKALEPLLAQLGQHPAPDSILALKVCDPAMGSGAFLVEACRQLADELVAAWHFHRYEPAVPPDEDILLFARRIVAQRCLYGVDRNPMAVDLAKLSLWLATLARDHPFTFLDHALRCGDSLVGLTRAQIEGFHWTTAPQQTLLEQLLRDKLAHAQEQRRIILSANDDMPPEVKADKLKAADDLLATAKLAGDVCIAAFFAKAKPKDREAERKRLWAPLQSYLADPSDYISYEQVQAAITALRSGDKPVTPFHWELEFPEVFSGENPGFDSIVGNPPFAGKNTLISSNSANYINWLSCQHSGSHGNSDLVAHFFRRTFDLIKAQGSFGLIATNTIAQGDTRSTGLANVVARGGEIFAAVQRMKWPGQADVTISVVWVYKGHVAQKTLDHIPVGNITAFLFSKGPSDAPLRLARNRSICFEGSKIMGMGFCFDDDNDSSSSLETMRDLMRLNSNATRVRPFVGAEAVNLSPTHTTNRFIIDFEDYTLQEAEQWPELLAIVRAKVKPERDRDNRDSYKARWWLYGERRPGLYKAIKDNVEVTVTAKLTTHFTLARLPSEMVFAQTLAVFTDERSSFFACMQSRAHEEWARFTSSTFQQWLRYAPTDCFETFPFPRNYETDPRLEAAGQAYYELRAALMIRNNEGLTATYNRFHDPYEHAPDIIELRELHAAMDRAVLDAYGWTDIQPTCEFILDYEEDDDDGKSRRKKPWRYRWPDEVRDDVLARLLALNAERAAEERALAEAAREAREPGSGGAKRRGRKPRGGQSAPGGLLDG